MSLSYQKLEPVLVKDPRVIINNKREYAVTESGQQFTSKAWTTTSVSSSSIQFSCPPPSNQIIVDRKVYFQLPVRLTFASSAPTSANLLQPATDAPRAFPLSGSIDTFNATINNQSVSINLSDVIHPLSRYNSDEKLTQLDYSLTPAALDESQDYSQLYGTNRNPLAFYGDSVQQTIMSRGGFPYTIVSNTPSAAVVDMVITEPIFLPPFYFGKGNHSGLYNVNTMDFNITFSNNAGFRMWSHDAISSGTTITSIAIQFSGFTSSSFSYPYDLQPLMLINYITPLDKDLLPFNQPITYGYYDIQRYPTDINNAVSARNTIQINSNNIQLSTVPRRIYLFARDQNSTLYSTCQYPDTYLSIENVSIQFQNKNGLLASASKRQLYNIAVSNGCNESWTEWSGQGTYTTGSFASQLSGPGSVLCLTFGKDIQLDALQAPGTLGQYVLQVQVLFKNNSIRSITPSFYIVVVSEGSFTVTGMGNASTNVGVLSPQDVLNAKQLPMLNYAMVEDHYGGDFFSGLKKFLGNANKFLQDSKILSTAASVIPHPIAQVGSNVLKNLGYGYDKYGGFDQYGGVAEGGEVLGAGEGVFVGGRRINRESMKNRLR